MVKEKKGVTLIDATIAVVLLALFSSLIMALYLNAYSVVKENYRNSEAMSYVIQQAEMIQKLNYEEVISKSEKISDSPYTVSINVEKYIDTPEGKGKEDYIKIVTIEVSYQINNIVKSQTVKILKTIE